MILRRRHLLYALAALAAVPLPASGVVGGGATQQSLGVSVSLDSCGVASTTVVCKLDASFSPIDGARYYTAAVTAPDGSVQDYGDVPSGAASLWVPYTGNGTYTVTVSAWGEKVKDPKPIATDTADTSDGTGNVAPTSTPGNSASGSGSKSSSATGAAPAGHVGTGQPGNSSSGSVPGDVTPTKPTTPAPTGDPGTSDSTTCVPVPATPPPPASTPAPTGGSAPPIPGVSHDDTQSMDASGVLPTGTGTPSCPNPTTTPYGGTCCPTPAG